VGDSLPAIRTLAEQLLVNPNTVARAYRELEAAGVVTSRVGSGTVVAEGVSPLARRERLRLLTEQVDGLLAKAHQLNFSLEELQQVLQERADELRFDGKGDPK
jgi:GntR family transcriptional regulator